jgi:hypothetical protein
MEIANTPIVKLVTFGRLNPGTPGHLSLLKSMIDQAIQYIDTRTGLPEIYFTLSNTQGGADNPFFCEGDEEGKIYKKDLFVIMITAMVKQTYPGRYFIINPGNEDIHIDENNKNIPINIYVKCSQSIFVNLADIIKQPIPENIKVHLFFGSDQSGFADIIKANLIKKGLETKKEIVERKKLDGCIDLKTLSTDDICEFFKAVSPEDAAKACSSSVVKILARDYSSKSCAAIETLYAPYLNQGIINQMTEELNNILNAQPPPPKPKVIKSKSTGAKISTTFKKSTSPKAVVTGSPKAVVTGSPKAVFTGSPKAVFTGSPKAVFTGSPKAVVTRYKTRRKKSESSKLGGKRTSRRKNNYKKRRTIRRRKL